jgi:hypothetical protein
MAFNKLGYYTLEPGKSMHILYWFGANPDVPGGADHGAQYCMADPEAQPGTLWVTEQGKERVEFPTPHGTTGFVNFVYHVLVRYEQPNPRRTIDFSIQGGGLV